MLQISDQKAIILRETGSNPIDIRLGGKASECFLAGELRQRRELNGQGRGVAKCCITAVMGGMGRAVARHSAMKGVGGKRYGNDRGEKKRCHQRAMTDNVAKCRTTEAAWPRGEDQAGYCDGWASVPGEIGSFHRDDWDDCHQIQAAGRNRGGLTQG